MSFSWWDDKDGGDKRRVRCLEIADACAGAGISKSEEGSIKMLGDMMKDKRRRMTVRARRGIMVYSHPGAVARSIEASEVQKWYMKI